MLEAVCQHCHSSPVRGGAPFPLVGRSDVLATRSGGVIRDLMIQQIEARRMPLTPVTIEPEDRDVLLAWLHAGAPAATTQECTATPAPDSGADATPDVASTDSASSDSSSPFDAGADGDAACTRDAAGDADPDGSSEVDASND